MVYLIVTDIDTHVLSLLVQRERDKEKIKIKIKITCRRYFLLFFPVNELI